MTELHLHPAIDTTELRAATPDWQARVAECEALGEPALLAALASDGIRRVSYRNLRALMRPAR